MTKRSNSYWVANSGLLETRSIHWKHLKWIDHHDPTWRHIRSIWRMVRLEHHARRHHLHEAISRAYRRHSQLSSYPYTWIPYVWERSWLYDRSHHSRRRCEAIYSVALNIDLLSHVLYWCLLRLSVWCLTDLAEWWYPRKLTWDFWWVLRFPFWANLLSQPGKVHTKGFSPVCFLMWTLRVLDRINRVLHTLQQ